MKVCKLKLNRVVKEALNKEFGKQPSTQKHNQFMKNQQRKIRLLGI